MTTETNKTYPFQVSVWVPGNNNPESIFEHGRWVEMARCSTRPSAEEVALCLSLRHLDGVQVAELTDGRFVGYKYLPEAARELK